MGKIFALTKRELLAYFSSPLAYVVLTAFVIVNGFIFWVIMAYLNNPQAPPMAPLKLLFGGTFYFWITLLFVVPVITMRLLAEERRAGTLEVLLTAPVSEFQVVIGKFVASLLFWIFLWVPSLVYVGIVASYSKVDAGPVAAGYLGILLIGILFCSLGLVTSAITRNQIIAAIFAFAVLLLLFSVALLDNLLSSQALKGAISYMSLLSGMDDYSRGIVDTRHMVYTLSLSGLFLFLATKALETSRGR